MHGYRVRVPCGDCRLVAPAQGRRGTAGGQPLWQPTRSSALLRQGRLRPMRRDDRQLQRTDGRFVAYNYTMLLEYRHTGISGSVLSLHRLVEVLQARSGRPGKVVPGVPCGRSPVGDAVQP